MSPALLLPKDLQGASTVLGLWRKGLRKWRYKLGRKQVNFLQAEPSKSFNFVKVKSLHFISLIVVFAYSK